MRKLFYVPIEPLEERYTEQWYKYFPVEFSNEFDVEVIDGTPLQETIKVGTFLDINSTIAYKNSQMIKIAELFNNGKVPQNSVFFFGDLEFWGIESLRLMADMNNIKVNLYAYLHAASYVKGDAFQIAENYQKFTELGWVLSMDKVFVATEHHKSLFMEKRATLANTTEYAIIADKIKVVGNPLFMDAYEAQNLPKENNILCTNRPDKEKDVMDTLRLFESMKKDHKDWNFIFTTGRKTFKSNSPEIEQYAKKLQKEGIIQIKSGLTKAQYHAELEKAKVVVTNNETEETFGYCVMEALIYSAAAICPDMLSHPELVPQELLYEPGNYDDCKLKIEDAMKRSSSSRYTDYSSLAVKYKSETVIQKMIDIMKG